MAIDYPTRVRGTWRLWWLAAVLWLALAAAAALALWHLRREALASGARELNLLSLALTDEIDRGLHGADEGLRALRTEWRAGHLDPADADAQDMLRYRAELMPLVESLWILDAQARTVVASGPTAPPDVAGFMPNLRQLGADGMALSAPFPIGGQPFIALAMRVSDADGWIVAALPAGALLGAFAVAAPAVDARMAVLRSDGVLLASTGAPPPRPLQMPAVVVTARPTIVSEDGPDGVGALVGLHGVPRYAVQILISRDLRVVLQPWRQTAQAVVIALALLLTVMAAAVHLVQRAERRRAQAQAALHAQAERSSRFEALGTLAGGVAHDFNNVLAGIVGYGEMAADAAAPGSAQARHLARLMQAALRGRALVERILAFSRGGPRAMRVFALAPVVEEVLALLAATLRPGVVVERVLQAGDARLQGDPTQAFEAVMNLCTNALQAMPDGGLLRVQLRRASLAAPRVLSHGALPAGDYLVLQVSDQGVGIAPEVMEHLFEPFFTTRAAAHGIGLGLAVVHGVVAGFGGAIDVQSRPGAGARFTLHLPECRQPADASPLPARGAPAVAGQRLLVVDDDPELAELTAELLRSLGYETECLHDPLDAWRTLQAAPERFAALVTDEVMPGMTGTELARAARTLRPELPVLLVSGYGGPHLAVQAAQAGVDQVLAKPVPREELARALDALLRR